MRNNTSQTLPQLPVVVGFTALAFLVFVPDAAQAQELFACYVPRSGVVYRIKEPGLKDDCTGRRHVEFSWAGLALDNGDVTLTVDGTVAASAFASASPLIFEAPAGTERMRIDETNGNVGIGTTSPTARLNIVADGAALRVNRASAPGADVLSLQADPAGGRISVNDQSGSAKVAILAAGNSFFNGGNVGIGTASPGARLDVAGQIKITGGSPGVGKVLTSDAAGLASWATVAGGGGVTGSGAATRVAFWNGASSLSSNADLFWDNTNSFLGIGTANPERDLHIKRNAPLASLRLQNTSSTGAERIDFIDASNADHAGIVLSNATDIMNIFNNRSGGSLRLSTDGIFRLTVTDAGDVGIGTLTPSEKLEVKDGNIRVTNGSFIDDGMTLNVPDYVFEEGYPLMPLDELREYIAGEKHLPNVPSAEDIERDGLNLSQFQMKLLEKIEELTLYLLAQQEQIEALRVRVQE